MNNIELIQGNCVEKIKDISDGIVDLTVTSPPYDNLRTYNGTCDWNFRQDWFENEYKSFDELLAEIGYWLYVQY